MILAGDFPINGMRRHMKLRSLGSLEEGRTFQMPWGCLWPGVAGSGFRGAASGDCFEHGEEGDDRALNLNWLLS